MYILLTYLFSAIMISFLVWF